MKKEFKIPKSLSQCADLYYQLRTKRYAMQHEVEAVKKQENELFEHLLKNLPYSETRGIAGKIARVTVDKKSVAAVKDWPKFYAYIKKTGSFDLLQRRLAEGAVKERWDADKVIPGVGKDTIKTLSVNALKQKEK
jgi:hypothetical protein